MGGKTPLNLDQLSLRGGVCLLSLLVTIPVMNCIQLLTDTNLGFWVGTGTAFGWLFLCLLLVIGYFLTMTAFIRKADEEYRTSHVTFMALRTFLLLLGLMLIWQKFEIEDTVNAHALVLTEKCESEGRSSVLHSYYKELQAIRTDASCAGKFSVEQCTGWVSNDWSRYLMWAESQFECTGVCPDTVARLTPIPPAQPKAEQPLVTAFAPPPPVANLASPASLEAVAPASSQNLANAGPVAGPAQPAVPGSASAQAAPGTTNSIPAGSSPAAPAPATPTAASVVSSALVHGSAHHRRLRNAFHAEHTVRVSLTERFSSVLSDSFSFLERAAFGDLPTTAAGLVPEVAATQPLGVDGRGTTVGSMTGAASQTAANLPESNEPNALFSRAHYVHKCGPMIAMDLQNRGQTMADSTFANGVAIFGIMIFSAALEFGVFMSRGKEAERPPQ